MSRVDIHPVGAEKRAAILDTLQRIEREHDVRVLFACESGSRGWGFSSPDSDYDARFVYVHRQAWYLTIDERTRPGQPQRDVIELPIDDELDVSGWDLRKALRLVRNSNPTLSEWLRSPIVYRQAPDFAARMIGLVDQYHSPVGAWYHYLNMARGNFRSSLQGERVRTKKYLYVLRPLLACQWLECEASPPPMAFEALLERLLPKGPLREEIDALLERKRASAEIEDGPRNAIISEFIEARLAAMSVAPAHLERRVVDPHALDEFFRATLAEDAAQAER